MSGRRLTLLKVLIVLVIIIVLAQLFPVKPLPPIEAGPREIASIMGFPISNSMLLSWIVTVLLIVLAFASTRRMVLVPSGLQNLIEAVIEAINNMVGDIAGERGKRFFPIVATIFLFVLLGNWLSLVPGVGPITIATAHEHAPLLRAPSADLNNTVALAVISVFMTQVFSIMALGVLGYTGRWFNFGKLGNFFGGLVGLRPRKGAGGLFWGIIDAFVGFVELFSELMKLITFSFRLFGNILAGEVILIVMAYLFAQVLPLPFYALELFVGFIQAFVFAILTLVFMNIATAHHGGATGEAEH